MLRTTAFLTQGLEIIMYKIDVRVLGMVATNCYLLCNTDTKECVLIEPAVAMSGNYTTPERLKSRKGIVKEVGETARGYYVIASFDE